MYLTQFEPFRELRNLERRLGGIFDEERKEQNSNISGFMPSVNTREDDKGYYIEVDLPGVKKEDISVDINKNSITISGERKTKDEVKEGDYYKVESHYGKFQRSFIVPDGIDSEAIDAKFSDGVLEILLPKSEQKDARKVEIQ